MIYVDALISYPAAAIRDPRARHISMKWCHLFTDGDVDELHLFAAAIGLRREWFQDHRLLPHYDLTPGRRAMALVYGAAEADRDTIARVLRASKAVAAEK